MRKVITLLALLLFAVSQGAFAQKTITGKVINGEDGLAMPGASVVVKGTTVGMATNSNGNFILNVPDSATIVVSFSGFKTVERPVVNQTQFDITLEPDVKVLSNVVVSAARVIPPERAVVTAMGVVRDKVKLTYSVQSVSGEELNRASDPNPFNALVGKVAGVNVMTDLYDEGTNTFIPVMVLIRGKTSWNHSSAPLLVVDGVPWGRLNENMDGRLSLIHSEQIENISVLKSANAAMLYGSDGANGVVVITMKK